MVAYIERRYDLDNREVSVTDLLAVEVLVERTYRDGKLIRTTTGNGLTRDRSYVAVTGEIAGFETRDGSGQVVESTVV